MKKCKNQIRQKKARNYKKTQESLQILEKDVSIHGGQTKRGKTGLITQRTVGGDKK